MPKLPPNPPIFKALAYIHAFKVAGILSNSKLLLIYRAFEGDMELAYLYKTKVLSKLVDRKIINRLSNLKPLDIIDDLNSIGIKTISFEEDNFPYLLKDIHDTPISIYYKGDLDMGLKIPVTIVGTREPTYYGIKAVELIISQLAKLPICIVSGLTPGIDIHAHATALKYNLQSIAVLGTGINNFYRLPNRELVRQIITSGGCLISEFPPNTFPGKANFSRRHRIIAGLSKLTIVIEASNKSPALITARYANEEGRDVYAIPGSIFNDNSLGVNRLIAQGATPLYDIEGFAENFIKDYKL